MRSVSTMSDSHVTRPNSLLRLIAYNRRNYRRHTPSSPAVQANVEIGSCFRNSSLTRMKDAKTDATQETLFTRSSPSFPDRASPISWPSAIDASFPLVHFSDYFILFVMFVVMWIWILRFVFARGLFLPSTNSVIRQVNWRIDQCRNSRHVRTGLTGVRKS